MQNPGTIELLLLRLSEALSPLPEKISISFLAELGVSLPTSWQTDGQLNIGAR